MLDAPFSFGSAGTLLEGRLNGQGPFRFGFDSGASVPLMLEPRVAERLGLAAEPRYEVSAGDGTGTVRAPGATIDEFEIGGFRRHGVETMILPGPFPEERHGTIGFPLFSDVLLTLDLKRSRFVVQRAGSLDASEESVLSYRLDRGLPRIAVAVGPLTLDAVIDVGAESGVLLPTVYVDRLPLAAEPEVVGRIATLFDERDLLGASLAGALTIGPHRLERPRLHFSDVVSEPNLGRGVLGDFALTFDTDRRLVRIDR